MTEISDLQAQVKSLVDKVNTPLAELRGEVDTLTKRAEADVLTQEKHTRMADEVTKRMEEIQTLQSKMQAVLDRPGGRDEGGDSESKAAMDGFLRGGIDLSGQKHTAQLELEIRAMSTDVGPDGGILVRPDFSQTVIDRIFESSPIRSLATVEQTGSKSREFLIDDQEAEAKWVNEGASSGETGTPQLGGKEIVAHKLDAEPKSTTEELQDAFIDVESWLINKVSDRFGRKENTAFVTGDGVNKPRGFLSYPAWDTAETYQRDALERVNSGAANGVTATGFINLQNSLIEDYQSNAQWAMRRSSFGATIKLRGNDQFFFGPMMMKDGVTSMQLLGKPVTFMQDIPAVGPGALAAAYGDFRRSYTILDRVGMIVLRDPFTNKGFITFYTTKRVGGDVTNFDALKIMEIAA